MPNDHIHDHLTDHLDVGCVSGGGEVGVNHLGGVLVSQSKLVLDEQGPSVNVKVRTCN